MAQMQYIFTLSLKDMTSGFYAKSPEYARLEIQGGQVFKQPTVQMQDGTEYTVVTGEMTFAQGLTTDSKGNLYWCDKTEKRIYRYDRETKVVRPLYDIHFMPSALAMDTEDRLLVAADYSELRKTIPGQPFQTFDTTRFHPFFSWFYKRSEKAYAVEVDRPYDTMVMLEKVAAASQASLYSSYLAAEALRAFLCSSAAL